MFIHVLIVCRDLRGDDDVISPPCSTLLDILEHLYVRRSYDECKLMLLEKDTKHKQVVAKGKKAQHMCCRPKSRISGEELKTHRCQPKNQTNGDEDKTYTASYRACCSLFYMGCCKSCNGSCFWICYVAFFFSEMEIITGKKIRRCMKSKGESEREKFF